MPPSSTRLSFAGSLFLGLLLPVAVLLYPSNSLYPYEKLIFYGACLVPMIMLHLGARQSYPSFMVNLKFNFDRQNHPVRADGYLRTVF